MDSSLVALSNVAAPFTLLMLATGVVTGLIVGAVPGVGALFGLAVLIPFTYQMDPYAAIALLLGLASVTTTSDTIPAVLIGVPGTVGAITTVEDGHPLAKQNQAGRALGAAYSASLIGGLFGAAVLALSIPVMRPLILAMNTTDFLAISLLGLLFVSLISGKDALKGLAAMLLGIMLSFVGLDAISASERMTGGSLYLWDGIPIATAFLGLFGLPELAMLMRRRFISGSNVSVSRSGVLDGIRDTFREWRLVLACSSIGSVIGAIPGVGVTVIDWVAYGFATRDRKDGPAYGQGNIRGVIAPESANNAKEGGYLIPTVAFGLPGSVTMALLLAAFTVHGLVPGRAMLEEHLSITYSMVMFLALANILGAGICLAATGGLARLATAPTFVILPIALMLVTLGALQAHGLLEDVVVLLAFGVLGFYMKRWHWPRAALTLGFVLGPPVERYYFVAQQVSGTDWIFRPSILAVAAIAAFVVIRFGIMRGKARPPTRYRADLIGYGTLCGVAAASALSVAELPLPARLFPHIVAAAMFTIAAIGLTRQRGASGSPAPAGGEEGTVAEAPVGMKAEAAVIGLCALLTMLLFLVGHLPAVWLFLAGYLLFHMRGKPLPALLIASAATGIVYVIFDLLVSVAWPKPILPLL